MKKLQAPITFLLMILLAASCKKNIDERVPQANEAKIEHLTTNAETPAVSQKQSTIESNWEAAQKWTSVEQPNFTVYYFNAKANISEETSSQGLIKVFKTSDTGTLTARALPFEETVNGNKYYWYYQVTEGNIMIMIDAYGSKTNPAEKSLFKYMVLDKNTLTNLEAKGISKADLMTMSLEKMKTIY